MILDATARMFGFTLDELCGPNRRRPLVTARKTSGRNRAAIANATPRRVFQHEASMTDS